jgi:Fe2+/Zn2+ uptake regulation proteins
LLGEQHCCLTAQEILDRLRASDRKVGIASVYRILDLLVSEGYVQKIDSARASPATSRSSAAASITITSSATAAARSSRSRISSLERALGKVEQSSGYDVSLHDVVLHGACGDCR